VMAHVLFLLPDVPLSQAPTGFCVGHGHETCGSALVTFLRRFHAVIGGASGLSRGPSTPQAVPASTPAGCDQRYARQS